MKIICYASVIMTIMVCFIPTAYARVEYSESSYDVELEAGDADSTSTVINAFDEQTMEYEKDVILGVLESSEGRYYGPYLKSSLFQFNHEGGVFQFYTNFSIPASYIMNGVSSYWLRVPVDPSQYAWWHVWCDWGIANTVEGTYVTSSVNWPALLPVSNSDWDFPALPLYAFDPGNVWSINGSTTYQIMSDPTGIYIRFDGLYHPDEVFTVSFTGGLFEGLSPRIYLTQERQSNITRQSFRFFDAYKLVDDSGTNLYNYGFVYDYNESMELDPAWAFLFTNGIGKEGMVSYVLKFANTFSTDGSFTRIDNLTWGRSDWADYSTESYSVDGYDQGEFLSFYMPYKAIEVSGYNPSISGNSIDWCINITLEAASAGSSPAFYVSLGVTKMSVEFWINNTENFLLCTTPYNISDVGILPDDEIHITAIFTPMTNSRLLFLGSDVNAERNVTSPTSEQSGYWGRYCHEAERASWNSSIFVNGHILPLFNCFFFSDGRYAQINETLDYTIYDFGWGIGYKYPGSTNIYMFLDNGGSFFYRTTYEEFQSWMVEQNKTIWDKIIETIVNTAFAIAGAVYDGISWVLRTVIALGSWIYNVVTKIIGWIVSVVTDIASKVSAIVQGMLYGVPILLVIFLTNYVGNMLYTGRLPRLSKERKLLKKLRPRSIMKQRAKYQRKMRFPVAIKQEMKASSNRRAFDQKNLYRERRQAYLEGKRYSSQIESEMVGRKEFASGQRKIRKGRRQYSGKVYYGK